MISAMKRRAFLYPGEEIRLSRSPKLHLHGVAKHAVDVGRMRLFVTASLFCVAFAAITGRLVELMVMTDGGEVEFARSASAPVVEPQFGRADITDRNGVLIATNLPTVNLFADAVKVPDAAAAAAKIVTVLPDLAYEDVFKKLSSNQRFVYLRRHLTPAEQVAVNRLGIPGVDFENAERRTYPQGALFAHAIGATDFDNHGAAGVEKAFDEQLRSNAKPLALSLDIRVQNAVRDALAAGISKFHADAGSALVMNVHSGELLAMVSLPDFDPKTLATAPENARFNRATLGLYEMGSTFKLFTAAMALDTGYIPIDKRYDATQPIKVGRFTISDSHPENRWLSVPEILMLSSNIGAAKMALDVGTETQKAFLRKLGLMSPLPLELPETGTPQYPSTWREINTITISYGHGISVTPVHVATAVSALVNGGILIPPTIVKRDTGAAIPGRQVVSKKTSDSMRAIMRMIVLEGTGKQAAAKGYMVGGKTGSAEKVTRTGGYSKSSLRTSFVSAFPMDAPQFVVLVILDEPQGTKETYNFATAGWNAAPTAGAVIAKVAPLLGVYPAEHGETFAPLPQLLMAEHKGTDLAADTFTTAPTPDDGPAPSFKPAMNKADAGQVPAVAMAGNGARASDEIGA
ncbi:MAG: penicillin-binding protein 2, partial [Rhodobacteraceae bacterium]|nr:penicillin-binding protein 2 [Paracoccaceae bacterium]